MSLDPRTGGPDGVHVEAERSVVLYTAKGEPLTRPMGFRGKEEGSRCPTPSSNA